MGTRSVIAKPTQTGFSGRYHHWDGYPSGLGATLYDAYQGHFGGDLDAMCHFLLDEHPAGFWTIVGRDLSLPCGYFGRYTGSDERTLNPVCYCHGIRSDPAHEVTEKDAGTIGCEYAYVLSEQNGLDVMDILSSYTERGDKMIGLFGSGDPDSVWRRIARIEIGDPEPDWKAIEARV